MIDLNLLNDPLQLGIRHGSNVNDVFDFPESMIQNALKLLPLAHVVGNGLQFIFQGFDLAAEPADLFIQIFPGD